MAIESTAPISGEIVYQFPPEPECTKLMFEECNFVREAISLQIRFWSLVVFSSLVSISIQAAEPTQADSVFDSRVAPLLAGRCLGCHNAHEKKGGLDLSNSASAFAGGESGKVIEPGKLDSSLLWEKVSSGEMPPKKGLQASEKTILKQWILEGAKWGSDPIDPFRYTTETRAGYDWWSLKPILRPGLPQIKMVKWPRNEIDSFILSKLETKGLTPAPEADRRIAIRRLSFDLLGLPPTSLEVAAFVSDTAPDAYEKLVTRLLDSPAYGERWARHWLDIVRFGESQGFERDRLRPNSWRYRDWVVWALNRDMPYDEFVRQQLAGDVLAPGNPLSIVATGYLVAAPWDEVGQAQQSAAMRAVVRQDELEDIVGTTAQTFLGLTANCARCHDHKFDPVTQREYYQLAAALGGVRHGERESLSNRGRELVQARQTDLTARCKPLIDAIAALENPIREKLRTERSSGVRPPANTEAIASAGVPGAAENEMTELVVAALTPSQRQQRAELVLHLTQFEAELRLLSGGHTYAITPRQPESTFVLTRGNPATPGEQVAAGGIKSLGTGTRELSLPKGAPESDRRRELANWITRPDNPLTARVMVNRLWHYHFGLGIVDTPNDFGFNGARPSHPELLDWLASELIQKNWSLKSLHRTIVLSATYRQSPAVNPAGRTHDAENRLLWRRSPLRLEAEELRDAVLTVAGELNPAMGGPGYQDFTTFTANSQFYNSIDAVGYAFQRRSLYRTWIRSGRNPLLDVFDCPDPSAAAPKRAVTTTPLQALALLNNPFLLRMSDKLAGRIQREVPADVPAQVRQAYQFVLQRAPTATEVELGAEFVKQHGLPGLSRVLFNCNEFLYVD
ncbi:MAG: Planctomycete cytochrome [Planctomycetaceae bacterium]|nr:Planctomycete cytochrome [Planctomycetaceae bacterium]